MSIACPYCKVVLTPKGLKPGKYTPKCPKCAKPFILVVPTEEGGTIAIEEIAQPKPSTAADALKKTDPNATGDFTEVEKTSGVHPPSTRKKPEPNVTGDFTDVAQPTPRPSIGDATGDFTEANEGSKAADTAEDTGDFTDVDTQAKPKPAKLAKTKLAKDEDDSTGDIPPKLGGYEVLKVLGKGGMGAVLLGRQVSLDRRVALKVMHPKIAQNPSFVARFTREAYAAAQLTHHNVVQIYDIGEEHGRHFFSMEFVPGHSLMEIVKDEGTLAPEVAVGYVLQAARGLRYGHNQGMVHRDIKPDNLMLNAEGIVKVADLGLVKLPSGELPEQAGALPASSDDQPGNSNLTRVGAVMGTPAYMSPEQSKNSAAVDGRADIYSLGCSLYVMLTGKTPFEGKTALEIISKHQTEPITPPDLVVKRVPKSLSAIVMKMTAKKPDDRYQTMDELIVALEGFLGLEKSGTFNPKEEQADRLEKCCAQFNVRSKSGLKKTLALGFFAACIVGVVGAAFAGQSVWAGGLLGLMVMTPIAYFVIHGLMTGSVVATKARGVVFGMRFFDWLAWAGGALLFLVTLYLFGMLWSWLGFAVLAVGLGFLLWFLTDRAQIRDQEEPLDEARRLFKTLRLAGLEEEQLRQFVCKFSGENWEPFYEAVFGYEAKLAARAHRKGDMGEVSKKHGAWREPVLAWLDARLEARRVAEERQHLQKVEAKALEAEGVSKGEAKVQAAAMAADLVGQAAEVKQARKEGKEAKVNVMVASARKLRKPVPGFNLDGKPLRDLWLKDFVNAWFGRRLRLVLGVLVFCVGLLWMTQNDLFSSSRNIFKQAMELDFKGVQGLIAGAKKPIALPSFLPIPKEGIELLSSINVPILGFLLLLSGVCFYGWLPSVVGVLGVIVGIAGPMFGVPSVEPLTASQLSLIAGAVLIVPVAWLVRKLTSWRT